MPHAVPKAMISPGKNTIVSKKTKSDNCTFALYGLMKQLLGIMEQVFMVEMSFLPPNHHCQSTNHNQWLGFILSSSTTEPLTEEALLPLCLMSITSAKLDLHSMHTNI